MNWKDWGIMKRLSGALVWVFIMVSSAFSATTHPINCFDVLVQTGSNVDGDYVIEPTEGKVFTVYCKDMQGIPGIPFSPKEYLPLVNTGGDYNFSQFTVGGWTNGTSVRTTYSKVRIDPTTLMIDIDDATFATTTGTWCTGDGGCYSSSIPYGVAMDCVASGSQTGMANIDLTGTPFSVNDTFYSTGYTCAGSVTFGGHTIDLPCNQQTTSVTGQVVNITGGGYAGGSGPQGMNSGFDLWLTRIPKLNLKLKWIAH